MIEILGDRDITDVPKEDMKRINDTEKERTVKIRRTMDPQARTRAKVYATGNKWAIENFEATH